MVWNTMVEFAEPIERRSSPSSVRWKGNILFWSDLKLKESKTEHDFQDSAELLG